MKTPIPLSEFRLVISSLLLAFILISDSGCVATVRTGAAQGSTEESTAEPVTLNRYLWGKLYNTAYLVPDSVCQTRALQKVRLNVTFWEGLVTLITLGIYCPVDITWVCAKEEPPEPVHH